MALEGSGAFESPVSLSGSSPEASSPGYLTIDEAAERVRYHERTIRRAIDRGALRAGRVRGANAARGAFRIRPADLDRWLLPRSDPTTGGRRVARHPQLGANSAHLQRSFLDKASVGLHSSSSVIAVTARHWGQTVVQGGSPAPTLDSHARQGV